MCFSSFHRQSHENLWLRTLNVFRKVSRGRGVSKQIESRVSEPSVQNPKEMPIMKTFTIVTRIKHQATINRYGIIEFSTNTNYTFYFGILKSSHLPNLAKEIQGNVTGKGLASFLSTSFPVFGLSAGLNPMTRNFSFFWKNSGDRTPILVNIFNFIHKLSGFGKMFWGLEYPFKV